MTLEAIPSWTIAPPNTFGELRFVRRGMCQQQFYPLPLPPLQLETVARDACERARGGYNVYFSLNPRVQKRGTNKDVAHCAAFFVDMDNGETPESKHLTQVLPPSAVVRSGRGLHIYWFLDEVIPIRMSVDVAKKLCVLTKSDDVWAAAQTPRLPGTWNWQTNPPKPVSVVHVTERLYDFAEVAHVVTELHPLPVVTKTKTADAKLPIRRVPPAAFKPLLPGSLKRVLELYDAGQADRSRADAALTRWALTHNWSDEVLFALCSLPFAFPVTLDARVKGKCKDCHSMHYSHSGAGMTYGGRTGPFPVLTEGGCLGCHGQVPNGTQNIINIGKARVPQVLHHMENSDLAGGNFYYVADGYNPDYSKGHNISGVSIQESPPMDVPPAFIRSVIIPGGLGPPDWPGQQQLTCAGTWGCHGNRTIEDPFKSIYGAHHTDDSIIDGSTVGKSYRFLYGIKGKEHIDWEYLSTTDNHNGYQGDMDHSTMDTISYLCGECHAKFHPNPSLGGRKKLVRLMSLSG